MVVTHAPFRWEVWIQTLDVLEGLRFVRERSDTKGGQTSLEITVEFGSKWSLRIRKQ